MKKICTKCGAIRYAHVLRANKWMFNAESADLVSDAYLRIIERKEKYSFLNLKRHIAISILILKREPKNISIDSFESHESSESYIGLNSKYASANFKKYYKNNYRTCIACNQVKDINDFYSRFREEHGYNSYTKECKNCYCKKGYAAEKMRDFIKKTNEKENLLIETIKIKYTKSCKQKSIKPGKPSQTLKSLDIKWLKNLPRLRMAK